MQQSLRLTVPKIHVSREGSLYSDPAELGKILRNLPFADMPSAVLKATNILSVINRCQMSYQLRMKLMRAFDVPYGVCHLFYTPQCPEQLGIIRSRSLQEQDAFREFTQEMSYGYKQVLVDALANNDKRRAYHALFGAFYYMSALLMLFYSVHQIQPLNIWGEMHRLYKLAENMEWTRSPQKVITLAKGMTLEWMYKKSLLMFTADPYHMETSQNWLLNHYLSKWSHCAEIMPFAQDLQHHSSFHIDLNRNDAISSQINTSTSLEAMRSLVTDNLITTTSRHLDQLHSGVDLHSLGFVLNPTLQDAEDVLENAVDHWGQKFKRGEMRSRCNIPCSMTLGLYYCHKEMTQGTEFKANLPILDGQIIDSSPEGCCLRIPGNPKQDITIGQLVVMTLSRPLMNDGVDTLCGVIRWVSQDRHKGSKIGVKILPGDLRAGFIKSLSGDEIAQRNHPALILVSKTSSRDYSIITSTGLYTMGRSYELHMVAPQRRYLIKANKLLNQTRALEHFQFQAAH